MFIQEYYLLIVVPIPALYMNAQLLQTMIKEEQDKTKELEAKYVAKMKEFNVSTAQTKRSVTSLRFPKMESMLFFIDAEGLKWACYYI